MPAALGSISTVTQILVDADLGDAVAKNRSNYVLVKAKSDFPAPSAGVISLAANTLYEINGTIALGTDRLAMGNSSIICGRDKSDDILTYTGTSTMITGTNVDFTVHHTTLVASGVGSKIFDISGDNTNRIEINNNIFANSKSIGDITGGLKTVVFRENLLTGLDTGITFSGNNTNIYITDNVCEPVASGGTIVTMNGGAYHTIMISRNMFETPSGTTSLNISPIITFIGGGLISSNSFEEDGTFLVGINAASDGWKIPPNGNVGIAGLLFLTPEEMVDSTYSTTASTMALVPLSIRYFKYSDYQAEGTKMASILDAEVTHDQSGQTLAIDVYNFTDGIPMGIGSDSKLDVDTIIWQSGNTIRYTFNGVPDLTTAKVGDLATFESATNASNNGQFKITAINDGSNWIEVTNPGRNNATDDEPSDSPCTAYGGSVLYITITTGGVYEVVTTPEFEIDESKQYRARLRRVSLSGGNPSVFIRNGAQSGVIRTKNF